MTMKIVPKTITGILHNLNKGTCDWGWQGLISYGCQNCVVVIDPNTLQVLQTLDKHKGYVVKTKWSKENYHHDLASPYSLHLASADFNGNIVIWDVAQSSVRAEFSDGSKPVSDMEWLNCQDACHDLMAALHPPYSLVLWNTATGTKLWKKTYTETLISFSFDPFEASRLVFLGQDCIVFVDDFSASKTPSSNGKKYYISSPSSSSSISNSSSGDKLAERKASKQTLSRRVTNILVGESSKRTQEDDQASLNECLQLVYHRACRNHLILLYPRELLILDLDIKQTVGVVPMERTGSPFAQVIPLAQRDVLMCLHENAAITIRVRRRHPAVTHAPSCADRDDAASTPVMDVIYDLRCQSDQLRVTRHNRVMGVACCPVSEMRASIIMSDSRVLIWELKTVEYQDPGLLFPQSPLFTPGAPLPDQFQLPSPAAGGALVGLQIDPSVPCPKTALGHLIGHSQSFVSENQANNGAVNKRGVLLKLMLTGLLSGVASPPLVMRMCPPLTTKNWAVYKPLLALGTSSGVIQVYNLSTSLMTREFSVHSCTVRGIEWVSLNSFLSFAYPSPGQNNLVRNELFLTDIQTGKTTPFRPNRDDESPIDIVKISYLKQYFVVVFKEKPFELWDLRTGTLLRQMPKNFPHVTALEWSPSHNLKSLKKRLMQDTSSSVSQSQLDLGASTSSSAILESSTRSDGKPSLPSLTVREHFVFTDADGLLYHFIVEGNMIKDGSKIPPDGSMGAITCIAWKAETLVLGDVDGNLNLWDLKARVSRAVPTHRGWVRKIKFAPGRGNMKLLVLYNDGCDIWDAKEVERMSTLKSPRDLAKVQDVDWAASDRPVVTCADGTVRIMDINFQMGSSPMEEGQMADPVFSPHLLPPKASLTLKQLLQHQPWRSQYTLQLEETEDNADISRVVNEQLQLLNSELKEYLPLCHFGTAQRCLLASRLFGDESELTFWTIALHYLRAEKAQPVAKKIPRSSSNVGAGDLFIPSTPARETHDLVVLQENRNQGQGQEQSSASGKDADGGDWSFLRDTPLETCYDVLCDNRTFQKYQLDRILTHDSKRATYDHTKKCAENLMLLGQADRAVQLLLETDSDNENYYVDSLRACLVASIRSSGASQSTIKLVATNLIASGKLSEGVQLLCLIDKGLDACRYLQTYGQWYQAAWLAKATLEHSESSEVLRRWAEHLVTPQVNLKSKAVLVLLSLGHFTKVVELLYTMRHFDRAALFVESCREFGLADQSPEFTSLSQSVFVEYARFLLHLGNRAGFEFYCQRAGDKGQQLLKDINNINM